MDPFLNRVYLLFVVHNVLLESFLRALIDVLSAPFRDVASKPPLLGPLPQSIGSLVNCRGLNLSNNNLVGNAESSHFFPAHLISVD